MSRAGQRLIRAAKQVQEYARSGPDPDIRQFVEARLKPHHTLSRHAMLRMIRNHFLRDGSRTIEWMLHEGILEESEKGLYLHEGPL
jgi:hypothetical protein